MSRNQPAHPQSLNKLFLPAVGLPFSLVPLTCLAMLAAGLPLPDPGPLNSKLPTLSLITSAASETGLIALAPTPGGRTGADGMGRGEMILRAGFESSRS